MVPFRKNSIFVFAFLFFFSHQILGDITPSRPIVTPSYPQTIFGARAHTSPEFWEGEATPFSPHGPPKSTIGFRREYRHFMLRLALHPDPAGNTPAP